MGRPLAVELKVERSFSACTAQCSWHQMGVREIGQLIPGNPWGMNNCSSKPLEVYSVWHDVLDPILQY
jgi:hypothetical protein